ncbi:ABC transporter substrate-binding protein [Bradyrhizobium sp. 162]|uniref:ABC transporter substrate-binding protein n=1 Tax=Bradyrhizobium sp. 162 TaxID=2782635 RepID=UPI002112760D|nr:ABC transporter substrate-binding protein [Bradyrhizobium sp. 162]MCK1632590.1 ABC transporter substrate-binding protein [Bradyrhizobium sp. 162]
MNRRDVLAGAVRFGATLSLAAPFVLPHRARAATTISFATYGGSYGDFMKEFWIKPFTAETGISVEPIYGLDLAKVKAQVETGNVQWDVFDGPGTKVYGAAKEGLWEQIDTKLIDPSRFVRNPPSFAVPTAIYSGGIGYDPNRTKQPPRDFSQFWDVKNFPGRRAIQSSLGAGALEIALVADGVAPSQLYPLDIDRAFKALDRIKSRVNWFAETTQGTSLVQTNEVDYSLTYANRVKAANEAGISIDISLDQCINNMQYFSVLRGSPRKEAAMRFLEFVTRPAQQASIAARLGASPVTKGTEQVVDAKVRRWLPDFSSPKNVFVNDEYWADHFVELNKRFQEWILI